MADERISLDELLSRQRSTSSGLRATVEEVPDQPDRVLITPYVAGVGCLCTSALTIPRAAVTGVSVTGESHTCCGKTLLVVDVELGDETLGDVFTQLSSGARTRRQLPASPAFFPGALPRGGTGRRQIIDPVTDPFGTGRYQPRTPQSLCNSAFNSCRTFCFHAAPYITGEQYDECLVFCDEDLVNCQAAYGY